MIKRNYAFAFLCIVFTLAARSQPSITDSSALIVLKIDPQNSRGATVSEVFDEVRFIPLETKKESIFGSISKLDKIDSNFVIYDGETNAILIFTGNGNYIHKIKAGDGASGPRSLYNFEVKKENNGYVIAIKDERWMFFYDQAGKFLKKAPLDWNLKVLNREYSLREYWLDKDSTLYEYVIFKNDHLVSKYFPRTKRKNDIFQTANGLNQQDLETNYFLTRAYSYDIYKLILPSISLVYRIIFPKANSLPPDFLNNPTYIGRDNRTNYFNANKEVIYGLSNVHQFGDNLFFKIGIRGEYDLTNALIYNLKNKESITLNHIEPDSRSYFLPVNDAGLGFVFLHYGFHAYSKGYLYTSYSAEVMFKSKDDYMKKSSSHNEVLTKYFRTENVRSNPVIIQLKPKVN